MTRPITNREIQRVTFVESLYNSIKKQTVKAIQDHNRFVTLAKSYVQDGLEQDECVELLMIDGLSREAAESYASMILAEAQPEDNDGLHEYSFQFDDIYGKRWSSHDIGRMIKAASEEEAWERAEELLGSDKGIESGIEPDKVISVNRVE